MDLALNNLQWLICYKIKQNPKKYSMVSPSNTITITSLFFSDRKQGAISVESISLRININGYSFFDRKSFTTIQQQDVTKGQF